jgi:hypothetical protein
MKMNRRMAEFVQIPATLGRPKEWEHFYSTNAKYAASINGLLQLAAKVFSPPEISQDQVKRVGFFLGRLCAEEFNEILLLAGNGYGVGAFKLLRGMYERAVTAAYIFRNPEQADVFVKYHDIHQHKALVHLKRLGGSTEMPDAETISTIEANYQKTKAAFTDEICQKCHATGTRRSWTKMNTADMAVSVSNGYSDLYYDAFYKPTLDLHTTAASIITRLEYEEDGSFSFQGGAQRTKARHATVVAQHILLGVLMDQIQYQSLPLWPQFYAVLNEFKKACETPLPTEQG